MADKKQEAKSKENVQRAETAVRQARAEALKAKAERLKAQSHRLGGFVNFVREQGVVGLAIGFVIGAAAATLVKSLVDNVVMPPIGILLGSADGIKGLSLSLGTHNGKEAVMNYGVFLNDLVNFLIIAFVIYAVVRILKLDRMDKKKSA